MFFLKRTRQKPKARLMELRTTGLLWRTRYNLSCLTRGRPPRQCYRMSKHQSALVAPSSCHRNLRVGHHVVHPAEVMVLYHQLAPDLGWNPTWCIAGREGAPRRFVYSIQHFLNHLGNLQIFFRQQLWRARWALWYTIAGTTKALCGLALVLLMMLSRMMMSSFDIVPSGRH